jgi:hemoglobin
MQPQSLISLSIAEQTGLDEAMIETVLREFYARVRQDELLAPIFAARIEDWDEHMERIFAFWSSVALATGRYQGAWAEKHMTLSIDARHFDRWLELFEATARELSPPAAADHLIERARRIARNLEPAIAHRKGILLAKGERLQPDDGARP